MMHAIFVTAVVALLSSPLSSPAQDAKPDFSGTWTVDASKSDFGPMPMPESMVAVIEHKEPTLKVTLKQKGPAGDLTSVRSLTTDGQENKNTVATPQGDQEIVSTSKWSGKSLITSSAMTMQGMAVKMTDTWELAPDGHTLTQVRDIATDQGSFTLKIVLTKP